MKTVYFDTETYLISYPDRIFPEPISLAWADNYEEPQIVHCKLDPHVATKIFLEWINDSETILVGHNIIFDLQVMLKHVGHTDELILKIFNKILDGKVRDTYILSQCNHLAKVGSLTGCKFSLAALAGIDEEEKMSPEAWRFNYHLLENVPLDLWEEKALQYALNDVTATRDVYRKIKLKNINHPELHTAAAFALSFVTLWGLKIDVEGAKRILEEDLIKVNELKDELQKEGYVRESGTKDYRAVQALCKSLGVTERTEKGGIATDRKVLEKYKDKHPAIKKLLELSKLTKLTQTFLPQMLFDRVHCTYNAILNTLRTSCRASNYYKYKGGWYGIRVLYLGNPYPSINIQQIPGRSDIRNLFIPEEGHKFITIDYANLELVCCAQACYNIFKMSDMREKLNEGINLHTFMGRIIFNDSNSCNLSDEEYKIALHEGNKDALLCRKAAKVVNLGIPGGQGTKTMFRLANEQFKLNVTYDQVCNWFRLAKQQYKEFNKFFGVPYVRVGYIQSLNKYPHKNFGYIVKDWGVFLCDKSYTACANSTLMQTPAALGTKKALIRLLMACFTKESKLYKCQVKAFVHDEFVISAPSERAEEVRDEMAQIMLEAMQEICPDVRVAAEGLIQDSWDKSKGDEKEYFLDPIDPLSEIIKISEELGLY